MRGQKKNDKRRRIAFLTMPKSILLRRALFHNKMGEGALGGYSTRTCYGGLFLSMKRFERGMQRIFPKKTLPCMR